VWVGEKERVGWERKGQSGRARVGEREWEGESVCEGGRGGGGWRKLKEERVGRREWERDRFLKKKAKEGRWEGGETKRGGNKKVSSEYSMSHT